MYVLNEFRQSLFQEKTYDVDYIYRKCFKDFVDNYKVRPISSSRCNEQNSEVGKCLKLIEGLPFNYIFTNELKSKETQACKESIPVICGIFKEKSGYYIKPSGNFILQFSYSAKNFMQRK